MWQKILVGPGHGVAGSHFQALGDELHPSMRTACVVPAARAPAADDAAMQIRTSAARSFTGYFFATDDWTILAWSRCAAMAGRTLVMRSFNSVFLAFGIRTLSIASRTCW